MSVPVIEYQRPLPGELGEDWETTWEIKNILRQALTSKKNERNNAAHSERATGKTTALIQFIAERHLVIHPDKKVGVVVLNTNVGKQFERNFQELFPAIRMPFIFIAEEPFGIQEKVVGSGVLEVYAEEMFMMKPRVIETLEAMGVFVAGVGTLRRPSAIRIREW